MIGKVGNAGDGGEGGGGRWESWISWPLQELVLTEFRRQGEEKKYGVDEGGESLEGWELVVSDMWCVNRSTLFNDCNPQKVS
jgi:hypothetical protein